METIRNMSKSTRTQILTYGMVIVAFVVLQVLSSAGMVSRSTQGLFIPATVYMCLAVSLNLVVGFSGELSLGHAGFMSVGAFTGVIAAQCLAGIEFAPLRLALAILVAGACAALAGFLIGIPVLRLHGDYLAIVTLAFGEIIKNVLNNIYVGVDASGLHVSMRDVNALGLKDGTLIINGARGAVGIPRLASFTAAVVLLLITLFVVFNLVNSRSGRAIMAVRDNRIAAESVGISPLKYRMMAFVVAAALAGMAGALYAMNYNTILPSKFNFNTSINILVFVVLGGMGNIPGGLVAAALLTVLPEKLRFIGDFRLLIYAVVLITVMLVSNNATLRQFSRRILGRLRRNPAPPAQESGGGDAQ